MVATFPAGVNVRMENLESAASGAHVEPSGAYWSPPPREESSESQARRLRNLERTATAT